MLEKIVNVFASCILLPSDVVTVEVEKNIDKDSIAYIDLIGMAIKTAKVMMLKCVLLDANIIIESQFCSSDGPAIQALAMIGHSNAGISMETLLKKTGYSDYYSHSALK